MREAAPGVQVDLGELAAQAGAQQQEQNIVIREQTWKIRRVAMKNIGVRTRTQSF
jgi:hypothetical protein